MVSTVSTRGVKFKFSEGEKVLCYEPDPTKAKVLYDSKVLELNVSRDSRGRKVPEYLIHFFGWSSSWDRCVKEEFILPDTEENRVLQAKLAQEAAAYLKGKRKGKLPPIIKESLLKKESSEEAKEPETMVKNEPVESSESSESSDEECERKVIVIKVPDPLKEKLVEDAIFITRFNKLTRLPCECNALSILEDYVKYVATSYLSPQDAKTGRGMSISAIKAKINFAKEAMDGIRLYFDFTLPHLLLYRQEKKQFYTLGNTCSPVIKKETNKSAGNTESTENQAGTSGTTPSTSGEQTTKTTQSTAPTQTVTRGGLRNQSASQKSPSQKTEEPSTSGRKNSRSHSNKESSHPPSKKLRAVGSREGLRSRMRTKSIEESVTDANPGTSSEPEASSTPHPEPTTSPASPPRQTRRSTQKETAATSTVHLSKSPTSPKKGSSAASATNSNPSTNLVTPLSVCISPIVDLASTSANSSGSSDIKNEKSSILSPQLAIASTSSASTSAEQNQQTGASLLDEVLSWKMLPDYMYDYKPASPSLIYGAPHLLRLFVKLPELLFKSSIPQRKMVPLLQTIDDFLQYLITRKEGLVNPSLYVSACQEDAVQPPHTSSRAI